jgi:hypothetical protein
LDAASRAAYIAICEAELRETDEEDERALRTLVKG